MTAIVARMEKRIFDWSFMAGPGAGTPRVLLRRVQHAQGRDRPGSPEVERESVHGWSRTGIFRPSPPTTGVS